ncbi:hypothetical protein SOVF_149390 [Spinacia oleracea]|nr:hypothetical protein SOVF_149390 [Spinacia oleracea]
MGQSQSDSSASTIDETPKENSNAPPSSLESLIADSNFSDILAARVANEGKEETIRAVACLAKRCLNMDGKQRPTMREAVVELEVISQHNHIPVLFQKNLPEVTVKTLSKIRSRPRDCLLPPYTSI